MKTMVTYSFSENFRELLLRWGLSDRITNYIIDFIGLFIVLVASVLIYYIIKFVIQRFLKKVGFTL